jgi:hypothetical protein
MGKKYSDDDLKDIIEMEGLEYAVRHYLNSEKIADSDTRDLWRQAEEALNRLVLHLGLDE